MPCNSNKKVLKMTISLKQHLINVSEEEKKNGIQITTSTDLNIWIEKGITTVEEFERDRLQSIHRDLYKEIYKIKASFNYGVITNDQLIREIQHLENELSEEGYKANYRIFIKGFLEKQEQPKNLALSGLAKLVS